MIPISWCNASIGELCQMVKGKAPIMKTDPGPYPLVTMGEEHKTAVQYQLNAEAVCVPMISSFGHGKPGLKRVHYIQGKFALSNLLTALVVKNPAQLSTRYLALYLNTFKDQLIVPLQTGAANMSLRPEKLAGVPVYYPPLTEQERIVGLLDEADALRRLRQQANARMQAFVPALFHEMFGDPAVNERGWEKKKFADIGQLDRGRSRHRPRDASFLYGGKYPFIQTGDIANSDGAITTYTQTYSEDGLKQSKLWPIGTLAITIAANIAKTAILTFSACFPDSIVGFIPGKDADVEYVRQWLVTLETKLDEIAPQAAQKNINLKILRELEIPLPPLSLQCEFAARVGEARQVQAAQARSQERLEALFQSMLARAFGGEL